MVQNTIDILKLRQQSVSKNTDVWISYVSNEWSVAGTIKEHYYVYRLMLSEKDKILFVLRNPVALYKNDKIDAEPRNGMEITFSTEHFEPTELLIWKR